jgi:hypothetical protein
MSASICCDTQIKEEMGFDGREMLTCALKAHVKSTNIAIFSCKLWIVHFKSKNRSTFRYLKSALKAQINMTIFINK